MIGLADVTLCCIDCATPVLALRALHASLDQCEFGAALLLTDAAITDARVVVRRIARVDSAASYSAFVLKHLAAHVATDFVLLVQWDGWVIDGARWEGGFRDFDYIGAPWGWLAPGRNIGNGGFSLRSRRLLAVLADAAFPVAHPEDAWIGQVWRPALEQHGLRFADTATARRFAVELDQSPAPSFGFHGLSDFWRAVAPGALAEVLGLLPAPAAGSILAQNLMLSYCVRARWAEAELVHRRIAQAIGRTALVARLAELPGLASAEALVAEIAARGAG